MDRDRDSYSGEFVKKPRKKGSGGARKGAGRKPGTQAHFSKEVKEALRTTFRKVGGAKYLENIARTDHRTFVELLKKMLPTEVATNDGPLQHEIVLKWMTPEMARNRGLLKDREPPKTGQG